MLSVVALIGGVIVAAMNGNGQFVAAFFMAVVFALVVTAIWLWRYLRCPSCGGTLQWH